MRPIHFARASRWSKKRLPPEKRNDRPDTDPSHRRRTIGSVAHHHLRLPDRRADLRAALGDGLLPAADARRKRLGPHDLRPRHGAAEPVLGSQPAVLRGHRRPLRHLARAGARRPDLRGRPLSDGDRRQPDDAAHRRRRAGRPRRRRRLVLDRARRLRPAHAAGEAFDRLRHRHGGRIGRHVPVRADQPGPDRRLWLVGQPDRSWP